MVSTHTPNADMSIQSMTPIPAMSGLDGIEGWIRLAENPKAVQAIVKEITAAQTKANKAIKELNLAKGLHQAVANHKQAERELGERLAKVDEKALGIIEQANKDARLIRQTAKQEVANAKAARRDYLDSEKEVNAQRDAIGLEATALQLLRKELEGSLEEARAAKAKYEEKHNELSAAIVRASKL